MPTSNHILIRPAESRDIQSMVDLSYIKRRKAEKAQPQFWRYAGAEAEMTQAKWFEELLENKDYIMLSAVLPVQTQKTIEDVILNLFQDPLKNKERSRVKEARDDVGEGSAVENSDIVGFIIGRLVPAPEVYNPGGLTLMIDDFCVKPKFLRLLRNMPI